MNQFDFFAVNQVHLSNFYSDFYRFLDDLLALLTCCGDLKKHT